MSKNNVVKLAGRDTIIDPLTELLRSGAEQLIYQAVEAALLDAQDDERAEQPAKISSGESETSAACNMAG
ncbi:MAG: hypothetical protein RPU34_06060 [Candidatus Sedimenticola sp. (ex Thyasira tokunagai)]